MCSRPCVATISASGGPFGLAMLPFGSDSWNGGTDELKAATIRTMKIARPTSSSTPSRPLRPETRLLRLCARAVRLLAGEETIAPTVAQPLRSFQTKRDPCPANALRTMGAHAASALRREDPHPAVDPARRAAADPALRLGRRRRGQARPLPLHRG